MAQVLDYSAGFPGAANIQRAGYSGAVRYIGFPDRRKCTTRGELDDFARTGIGMALVYQDGTGDWQSGHAGGQSRARRARDHANAIGFPGHRPIYLAIDRDIVSEAQFGTVMSYLDGAASVLGRDQLGVYGEYDVVRRALDGGRARFGWQTAAWSGGRRYAGAHLYQRIGTVHVGGIACDANDLLAADWGQHNFPIVKEDPLVKNLILGRNAETGAVWVGDGLTRRHVADELELSGLQYWIGQKGGDATLHDDFRDLRVLGFPLEERMSTQPDPPDPRPAKGDGSVDGNVDGEQESVRPTE